MNLKKKTNSGRKLKVQSRQEDSALKRKVERGLENESGGLNRNGTKVGS